MILRALGYELSFTKQNTVEDIRVKKIKDYELNAIKALISAEMTLELQQVLLSLKVEHNRTEAEVKGITDAIEFETKSVQNWNTQLEVIKSWK